MSGNLTVLVYSDDQVVRENVRMSVGRRPVADLPAIDWLEASTGDQVLAYVDAGGVDLVILDGEAWPTGGMGLARQLHFEIVSCPPMIVLVARRDDKWLVAWCRADAALRYPLDPVETASVVERLLRQRLTAAAPPSA